MASFRFRLQTVLDLRRNLRDRSRSELAQALAAEAELEDRRNRLAEELSQLARTQAKACGPGPVEVDRLIAAQRHQLLLDGLVAALGQQMDAVQAEIERRREALTEAERGVRALELLRERQEQRHATEVARREQRELDELAARQRQEATL